MILYFKHIIHIDDFPLNGHPPSFYYMAHFMICMNLIHIDNDAFFVCPFRCIALPFYVIMLYVSTAQLTCQYICVLLLLLLINNNIVIIMSWVHCTGLL